MILPPFEMMRYRSKLKNEASACHTLMVGAFFIE